MTDLPPYIAALLQRPSFDEWSPPDMLTFGPCPECGRGMREHRSWDAKTKQAEWAIGCPHTDDPPPATPTAATIEALRRIAHPH